MVTRMPTSSETITVRACRLSPWFGSVKPTASNSENRPFARPSPMKRPLTEASTPITVASISTIRRICRRDAPIVLSVANSRVRWAIVIDSELAITNEPTKRAMPPKASRKVCRKSVKLFVSLASFEACSTPRSDLRLRREDLPDLVEELRLGVALLPRDPDLVELARLVEEALRRLSARTRRASRRR